MDDQQLLRYSRHLFLPEIDIDGQQTLLGARVLVVGVGGLGSPVALYLAAAGVGCLHLVDDDDVEISNLQRQIAHATATAGMAKVDSGAQSVARLNPDCETVCTQQRLQGDVLIEAVAAATVVVDCCDNFATRFALNRACVETGTPLVSGAAIRWEGQLITFDPRLPDSPCYHCLYEEGQGENASCSESGVVGPLVGMIGSAQALETLKVLLGMSASVGHLSVLDAKLMEWRRLRVPRNPHCVVCANG